MLAGGSRSSGLGWGVRGRPKTSKLASRVLRKLAAKLRPPWARVASSHCMFASVPSHRAGGVITFMSNKIIAAYGTVRVDEIIPGRALEVRVSGEECAPNVGGQFRRSFGVKFRARL